jgi:hypothetical protein
MSTLLVRSLTLVAASLLAMPPGWCCPALEAAAAPSAPVSSPNCPCHTGPQSNVPSQEQAPAPASNCRCDSDVTPTTEQQVRPVEPAVTLLLPFVQVPVEAPVPELMATVSPEPLLVRILHCVWLI